MFFSSDSVESIVKMIFPLWMYEFEWREDTELVTSQIEIVLKRIKNPSKRGPVTLYNKIKEECEHILIMLQDKLTTKEAIQSFKMYNKKCFKSTINVLELYKIKEYGRWLTSSESKEILSYATKLKSLWNAFELIKLQIDLDKIIPYKFRYSLYHLDSEEIWYAAITSSPLLVARDELREKIPTIIYMYDDEWDDETVSELYNDILALRAINDIISSNIFELSKPTKGIVNGGFFPMAFFVALWYSFVWWNFSLRNFIYAFIAVFVILVVKDLVFPKD